MFAFVIAIVSIYSAFSFTPTICRARPNTAIKMNFNPSEEAGVSGPFGFFDPLGISPTDKRSFQKYRESEVTI